MRPTAHPTSIRPSWQAELREAVRSVETLLALLDLPATDVPAATTGFSLLVPRSFIARMRPGDRNDPLLRQVLPDPREDTAQPGFVDDPLDEATYATAGVVRKYRGRALLITTGACPVHCRYCFRRAFPYDVHNAADGGWAQAIEALRASPGTTEIILSGGDPLTLSDRKLTGLVRQLESVPQLETLRIHTRFPVTIPQRITPELVDCLGSTRLRTVVVIHANHPQEIDAGVQADLRTLANGADAVLNQSVLLKGINDDAGTLATLSQRLWQAGVLPYYLHLLDPVTGAAHFEAAEDAGRAIVEALRARLPGYLVPRLVREIPGRLSKTIVV